MFGLMIVLVMIDALEIKVDVYINFIDFGILIEVGLSLNLRVLVMIRLA